MAKLKDLTGEVFGYLTVVERAPDYIQANGKKRVRWRCVCQCGKTVDVMRDNLVAGRTISCGCYNEKIKHSRYKDISNQRFGELVAIEPTLERDASGQIIWNCKCDCGNFCKVSLGELRSGDTQSCGCTRWKKAAEKNRVDYSGKKFNMLTALYPLFDDEGKYLNKWHCRCDCGREIDLPPDRLGHQLSCGCSTMSKGEYKINQILREANYNYLTQKTFPDLRSRNNKVLRFDFAILDSFNNLIALIEYQGEQHYQNNAFFNQRVPFNIRLENDQLKRDFCKEHKIKLIEIPYWEYDNLSRGYLDEKIWQEENSIL